MARRAVDVAIVGAGLSGLAAAQRIEQHGLTACIIEARDRIGGRVAYSETLGPPYDAGAQFLHPNCTQLLALAARYGVEMVPAPSDGALVRSFRDDRQRIDDAAAIFGDEAAIRSAFSAIGELQTMMATLPDEAPWAAERAAEWDAVTFRDWAAQRISDPVALAMFVMRPTFDMALGWDNISLLAVLAHIKAGGIEKAMGLIVKVAGGVAGIAAALAADLDTEIIFNTPVRAIRHNHAIEIEAGNYTIEARAVVIAVSPVLADRIAFQPALPHERIFLQRGWHESPSVKTIVIYDRPWWRDQGLSGGAIGDRRAAPLVMDGSIPGRSEGVLVIFSSCGGSDHDPAAIISDLVHYFGEAAASPVRVVSHNWLAEHWTAGCGSAPPPGLLSRYGAALREPVGPIFWAGAESATIASYNMEGAVTAGQRAADEAAQRLYASVAAYAPTPSLSTMAAA